MRVIKVCWQQYFVIIFVENSKTKSLTVMQASFQKVFMRSRITIWRSSFLLLGDPDLTLASFFLGITISSSPPGHSPIWPFFPTQFLSAFRGWRWLLRYVKSWHWETSTLLLCEQKVHKVKGVLVEAWSCLFLPLPFPQKVFSSPHCCNPSLDLFGIFRYVLSLTRQFISVCHLVRVDRVDCLLLTTLNLSTHV